MRRSKRATITYNFTSLSDLVELIGSFHGPINVREDMRAKCRKEGITLDTATVSASVTVVIEGE